MFRSGGLSRRRGTLRILGAWVGLLYVCASAAGAAGVGSCVHATFGEGHGHGSSARSTSHAATDHAPAWLPCAAGTTVLHPAEAHQDSDTTTPCDCLGDCSVGAGVAELPRALDVVALTLQRLGNSEADDHFAEAAPAQHRLPYPNAPPLL